jgi:hypothetical protein
VRATGNDIFRVTGQYLRENGLQWKYCVIVCADGASSVTSEVRGFVVKVRELNPEMRFDHCLIHREAIVAKTSPGVLNNMLDEVIRTVNFFKWRPVNSRLFRFYARK